MPKTRNALDPPPLLIETPERRQHSPVVDQAMRPKAGKAVETVRRVLYEHPLDVMLHRALLTDPQHAAGIKVRQYAELAQLRSRVTSRYDQSVGAEAGPEAEAHAREMLREAMRPLDARERSVVLGCCAHGEWPGVWALRRHWPTEKRTPIEALRSGLSDIAARWRIT
jgi:hypothetical protein